MTSRNTNNCCVDGCRNKQNNQKLSFFTLPKECERRNQWLRLIGRPDLLNKPNLKHSSYKVCSAHFKKSMLSEVVIRKLLPAAMPTELLPTNEEDENNSSLGRDASTQTANSFLATVRNKNASKTIDNTDHNRDGSKTPGVSSNASQQTHFPEPEIPQASTPGTETANKKSQDQEVHSPNAVSLCTSVKRKQQLATQTPDYAPGTPSEKSERDLNEELQAAQNKIRKLENELNKVRRETTSDSDE